MSTAEQERSGLGLAAQKRAIEEYAALRGWALGGVHVEVASGSRRDRPVLAEVTASLGKGDSLVVARLDRLTRSLLQFAGLVDEATANGWSLVVVDQGFDMGTPAGRAMAGMCAVFADYERDLIRERTRAAMRSLPRERRNGRPCYSDEVRARARGLREGGRSLREIADTLTREGVQPVRGGSRLTAATVSRLLVD